MPNDGSATDYPDPSGERTVLNKCHSYILDHVHTRSEFLSHFFIYKTLISHLELFFYNHLQQWRFLSSVTYSPIHKLKVQTEFSHIFEKKKKENQI